MKVEMPEKSRNPGWKKKFGTERAKESFSSIKIVVKNVIHSLKVKSTKLLKKKWKKEKRNTKKLSNKLMLESKPQMVDL